MLRASLHLHCTPSRASELSDAFSSCVPRVQLITPRHRRSSVHLQCLPACDLHHLHSATVPRACLRRAHAGLEPCKGEHPPPWRQLWASVPPPPPPPPPPHTHTPPPPHQPPHHTPPTNHHQPSLRPCPPPRCRLLAHPLCSLVPPFSSFWPPGVLHRACGSPVIISLAMCAPACLLGRSACMLIVVYMLGAAMLTCIVRTSTARGSPQVGSRCCAPPVVWVASESVWCSPASTPYCPWLYARQQVPPTQQQPPSHCHELPSLVLFRPPLFTFRPPSSLRKASLPRLLPPGAPAYPAAACRRTWLAAGISTVPRPPPPRPPVKLPSLACLLCFAALPPPPLLDAGCLLDVCLDRSPVCAPM